MAGTRKVRMLVGISGYRHDDRKWPPMGETIEVPDWEADDLIRGGNAVPAGQRNKAQEPGWNPPGTTLTTKPGGPETEIADDEPELAAKAVAQVRDGDGEQVRAVAEVPAPDDGENSDRSENPAGDPPPAPSPGQPKQDWIDYAVACGAEQDKAAAMTKADLMSRYGGRL